MILRLIEQLSGSKGGGGSTGKGTGKGGTMSGSTSASKVGVTEVGGGAATTPGTADVLRATEGGGGGGGGGDGDSTHINILFEALTERTIVALLRTKRSLVTVVAKLLPSLMYNLESNAKLLAGKYVSLVDWSDYPPGKGEEEEEEEEEEIFYDNKGNAVEGQRQRQKQKMGPSVVHSCLIEAVSSSPSSVITLLSQALFDNGFVARTRERLGENMPCFPPVIQVSGE